MNVKGIARRYRMWSVAGRQVCADAKGRRSRKRSLKARHNEATGRAREEKRPENAPTGNGEKRSKTETKDTDLSKFYTRGSG